MPIGVERRNGLYEPLPPSLLDHDPSSGIADEEGDNSCWPRRCNYGPYAPALHSCNNFRRGDLCRHSPDDSYAALTTKVSEAVAGYAAPTTKVSEAVAGYSAPKTTVTETVAKNPLAPPSTYSVEAAAVAEAAATG